MGEGWARNFPMIRKMTNEAIATIDPSLVDVPPQGMRNTLRWQFGHIVYASELLLLRLADQPTTWPPAWETWFGMTTSPTDFTAETPAWQALRTAWEASTARVAERLATGDPDELLAHAMVAEEHLIEVRTLGDAAAYAAGHEAWHMGQIMVYRRQLGA